MYYYIYKNSINEIENALNILNIEYYTKNTNPGIFIDTYTKINTHKFNKKYQKLLTEYFLKINKTIIFSNHSIWIKEIEDLQKIKCIDCNIEINTFGNLWIKRCKICYINHKNNL